MNEKWMRRALENARKGWGKTSPNPLVGCVIVRDGLVLAEGYHAGAGLDHAERAAIKAAINKGISISGASLYVNLEPCAHHGRTPPCTDIIISSGLSEVFIAMADPNPRVSGKGVAALTQAGIKVHTGLLADEARCLNEPFRKYITTGLPFVIMKTAMSIDGKIADSQGRSRWITGETSRQLVHHWRDRASAIIAGSGTVLADNPALTTRLPDGPGRDPVRVLVDSCGVIPLDSRAIGADPGKKVIIAAADAYPQKKLEMCAKFGIRVLRLDDGKGKVDLAALLKELGRMEMDCILLEGGGSLNASFLQAGLVDKLLLFMAPLLIGGACAVSCFAGNGALNLDQAIRVKDMRVTPCGDDWLIEGYPSYERSAAGVYRNN